MSRYYNDYPAYVPVAQRRKNALKEVDKLRKKGKVIEPVEIQGRIIARSFWGKGWCEHLEAFGDYSSRLPRGRTYARNGSVCHLGIKKGKVEAIVSGSELYRVSIKVTPLTADKWNGLKGRCTGRISSLLALLQGELSEDVMAVVADPKEGLFPLRNDIAYDCDCPDGALMCKHISAVMYGIGARLDTQPELLFHLRAVNHEELISAQTSAAALAGSGSQRSRRRSLSGDQLGNVFGIELEASAATPKSKTTKVAKKKTARKTANAAGTKTTRRKPFKPSGPVVVALRKKLSLSKSEFAKRLQVSTPTITNWESAPGPLNLREENLTRLRELFLMAH